MGTETIIIYLDKDRKKSAQRLFKNEAEKLAKQFDCVAYGAHTGERVCEIGMNRVPKTVKHLIFICHGGTTWLMNSKTGISKYVKKYQNGIVSIDDFVNAWRRALHSECKISLCACMCSSSPRWYLVGLFGRMVSNWGVRGYRNGGEYSFAEKLKIALGWRGINARIRGHRTSGHALYNPILAEHRPEWNQCRSAFHLLVGEEPTRANRRSWVRDMKGIPSKRWLLFEEEELEKVIEELQEGCDR